jgi:hypothetical protein
VSVARIFSSSLGNKKSLINEVRNFMQKRLASANITRPTQIHSMLNIAHIYTTTLSYIRSTINQDIPQLFVTFSVTFLTLNITAI